MSRIVKTTAIATVLVFGTLATSVLLAQTAPTTQMPGSNTQPGQMMSQDQMSAPQTMSGQFANSGQHSNDMMSGPGNMANMMGMFQLMNAAHNPGTMQGAFGTPDMMGPTDFDAMTNFLNGLTDEQRQFMAEMLQTPNNTPAN